VVVADNVPGGRGMRSERVAKALKDEEKSLGEGGGTSGTSGAPGGPVGPGGAGGSGGAGGTP
jgi:hypothetical protein